MIMDRVNVIDNMDAYLERPQQRGVFVAPKWVIKKSGVVSFDGVEPDFVVFDERGTSMCHVVELKDGCEFDTKASSAEFDTVFRFIEKNAQRLPYMVAGRICCFNEESRDSIVRGFKNKITAENALTGREFCELLGISYDEIVLRRAQDRAANFEYFMHELVADSKSANRLRSLLE